MSLPTDRKTAFCELKSEDDQNEADIAGISLEKQDASSTVVCSVGLAFDEMERVNVLDQGKKEDDVSSQVNNLEDCRRVQRERELLAIVLATEKENIRQMNEELDSLKSEKWCLEQELAAANQKLHTISDEKRKIQDELSNLKQTNERLTGDIIEVRSTMLNKQDEMKAIQNELSMKDVQLTDSRNKEIQIRRVAKKFKDLFYELKTKVEECDGILVARPSEKQASIPIDGESAAVAATHVKIEKVQIKEEVELSSQLTLCQKEIDQLRKEKEVLLKGVVAGLKTELEANTMNLLAQNFTAQETIARTTRENELLKTLVNQLQFQQEVSTTSASLESIIKSPSSDLDSTTNVKLTATPSAALVGVKPSFAQNCCTAAVLQTSNGTVVKASSSERVATTAVPLQQQDDKTGNLSTTKAMSSSSYIFHTDYMPVCPARSSKSSSSLTSPQELLQQPQIPVSSNQVINPGINTSGLSSSFLTPKSSQHQTSSINMVTQPNCHKRPRYTKANYSLAGEVKEFSESEKISSQSKRTGLGDAENERSASTLASPLQDKDIGTDKVSLIGKMSSRQYEIRVDAATGKRTSILPFNMEKFIDKQKRLTPTDQGFYNEMSLDHQKLQQYLDSHNRGSQRLYRSRRSYRRRPKY